MNKAVNYTGFAIASLGEGAIFLTTTSYVQLAIAILLYFPLTYFAFQLFPRKSNLKYPNTSIDDINRQSIPTPNLNTPAPQIITNTNSEEGVEILDFDKRAFLKLVGASGLAFFVSSLFTKRAENLILGKTDDSKLTTIQNSKGNVINPAEHHPTDSYKISEVDYGVNSFYGFIDRRDGWFIMKEDLNEGTFRYIKGDANFRENWNNRNNLKYEYFNQVFPES